MPEKLFEFLALTYFELFFLIIFATKQDNYIENSMYFNHTKMPVFTGVYVAFIITVVVLKTAL
jgi:hypothetical protein